MDKDAFKIICDLIYRQAITYDEAQILIEAIMGKDSGITIKPERLEILNEGTGNNPNIWEEPGTNPYKYRYHEPICGGKSIIGHGNPTVTYHNGDNTTFSCDDTKLC